ncbi:transcriptional regulator, LysR family [Paraburkholderia tropica]|uniref:Transcriptional regulator, LysR family n=2 Tax=Paraburkholderia tropica TaxID=92647 RepID=A0AAQ1GLQ5_9BURK|nr:LysR family transcriptional regulator [Paraburkholderia tropica]SEK12180.1 transcriptional regulator, LysR family [Paraburkholderia tropica]
MDMFKSLKAFIAVGQLGSFTQAARASGLSTPAVSRAVSELEGALRVQLFNRSTRRVSLTEEGTLFFTPLSQGIQMIESSMSAVCRSNTDLRGVIRIGGAPSISAMLTRLIAEFSERHPEIEFDVSIDERHNEVLDEQIDVAVRVGSEPECRWVVRSLGPLRLVHCAAPHYLRQRGAPRTPDDLGRHRCIGRCDTRSARARTWDPAGSGESPRGQINAVATFNDDGAIIQAALAGVGIAQIPQYLVRRELDAGRLVQVLPEHTSERSKVMLCYPRRAPMPMRVRSFIDFAVSRVTEELNGPPDGAQADMTARRVPH